MPPTSITTNSQHGTSTSSMENISMAPPETSIQTSNVPQNTTMENTPPENISPERVTPQKMLETRPEISSDGRSQPVEPGSLATGHNGKKSG